MFRLLLIDGHDMVRRAAGNVFHFTEEKTKVL
jgi:hypothetical protein